MPAPRNATLNPQDGSFEIDGFPLVLGQGVSEETFKAICESHFKRVEGVVSPTAIYGSEDLKLKRRTVRMSLCFKTGILESISLTVVGIEWWTQAGHQKNSALCRALFGRKRTIKGGRVVCRFERAAGAMYDGGSVFSIRYDV